VRRSDRWLLALAAAAAVAVAFLVLGGDRGPDSTVDLGRPAPEGAASPAPQEATADGSPTRPRDLATREPSRTAAGAAPARDGDRPDLPPRGKGRLRVVVETTDGKPISGAVVRWGPEGGESTDLALPTGSTAEVEDTFAASGPLTVTVLSDAYDPEPSSARVEPSGGTVTFRMRPRVAVRLRLRDVAANGPIRLNTHATIRRVGDGGVAAEVQGTWPDDEGRIPLHLGPGSYDVEVKVAGYRVGSKRIEVSEAGGSVPFDIDLARDDAVGWIELAVAGASRSEHGLWTIVLRVNGDRWTSRPASVPSEGRLRIDGVPAGTADVMVWNPKGEVGWARGVAVSSASGGEASITLAAGLPVDRAGVLRDRAVSDPIVVTAVRAADVDLPLVQLAPGRGNWLHDGRHDLAKGPLGPYPFPSVDVVWKAGDAGETKTTRVERR
jgi:hypothetical protein